MWQKRSIDDLPNIKEVKPEYYIHLAVIKCQEALQNPDINQAVAAYMFYVQHIETLCYAANLVPKEYDGAVKKYREELKADGASGKDYLIKEANNRLKLLLTRIFSNRTIEHPMRDKGKREIEALRAAGQMKTTTVEEIEKFDLISDADDDLEEDDSNNEAVDTESLEEKPTD